MSVVNKISKGGKRSKIDQPKPKNKPAKTITNHRNRTKAFSRRKDTLLQKALDIHVVTNAEVMIVLVAPSGMKYTFDSSSNSKVFTEEKLSSPFKKVIGDVTPSPFSPKKMVSISTQTTESFFKDMSSMSNRNSCRICGEEKLKQRAIWVGCSFNRGSCDFWSHALCLGIGCKTQSALSKVTYYCPKHVGSIIGN